MDLEINELRHLFMPFFAFHKKSMKAVAYNIFYAAVLK